MSGFPVIVVPTGGLAVTEIPNGVAMALSDNAYGVPVTIVPSGGIPVTFDWIGRASALGYAAVADFNNDRYALPALGGELVTNGGFDNGLTGYTVNALGASTAVVTAGQLVLTGDGTNAVDVTTAVTTESGKLYSFTLTVAANSIQTRVGSTAGAQDLLVATNINAGQQTVYFTATGATSYIRWLKVAANASIIDNISVKEVSLTQLRSVSRDEWFSAYTASSTTARSYQDSAGTIKTDLLANAARFDWTNGKRQLLLENAGTNLITYSEDFGDASWTKGCSNAAAAPVVTANNALSPAGTLTAERVQLTLPGDTEWALVYRNGITCSASTTYAQSIWIKASDVSQVGKKVSVGCFDAVPGAFFTKQIATLTDQWQRITPAPASTQATSTNLQFFVGKHRSSTTGVGFTNAEAATDFLMWGAQLEASPFASAYIPTSASAVTRAIETFRLPPIVEAVLQRASGGVVVRAQGVNNGSGVTLLGLGGSGVLAGSNATRAQAITRDSAGAGLAIISVLAADWDGAHAQATGFDAAGHATSFKGSAVVTSAAQVAARTEAYLGRPNNSTLYGNGRYDFLGILASRPTNAALQALAVPA
jgi:hypothetical protein